MTVLSANIQANTTGFKSAVESAKRELELFNKSNKALAQTMRGCNDVTDLQISAFSKSVNALEKATAGTKTYKQSAALLEKELQKLKQQWNNLSDKAKQGEFGRYMSESINQTKAKLAELNNEMSKPTKSWGELAGQMNVAGVNVGDVIGKLKSLNPAVLGVATAAKVMTDAFRSSETAMDGARRTMSGLQNAYDTFVRAVRDGDLDFSSIFGAFGKGQDKYDAEDALGSLQANNKAVYEQLQADIAKARDAITEGGDVNVGELKKRVESQYTELIDATKNVLDKSVDALARNEGQKTLIEGFLVGKNPNATLERMKEESKKMVSEMANFRLSNTTMELSGDVGDFTWNSRAAEAQYAEMEARKKNLDSIIDSEAELQKLVETQTQLNALTTAQYTQLRTLSRMQNQIDTQEKQRLNELKKAEEDRLKVLQREREEAKRLSEATEDSLVKSTKGRTTEVQTGAFVPGQIDTSSLKGYDWVAQYKERLTQQKKELDYLQLEVSSINTLANAWGSLWSCIGEGDSVLAQTMQAMGSAVQNFGNMFVQLSQIQFQAAQAGALAKGTESAAALPFPYNLAAIGTVVGTIISTFASFKNIGKFAGGGIIEGASSIGDYNIARVNDGEMIFNKTQQKRLFNLANGIGGRSNETMETPLVRFVIKGQDLVGVFSNHNNKMNRVR